MHKPVVLVIRDGWGYRREKKDNFIAQAKTPYADRLMKEYPNTLLDAAGEAAGLPKGYQGNSEVGHMTIGAGRIILQSLTRINKAIETGEFFRNKYLLEAIDNCKSLKSELHITGLLQEEGVHSHNAHLYALLELCKKESLSDAYIHVITDGRDAPPTHGVNYMRDLLKKIRSLGVGRIATVSGRYYAMDRDKRWERTKKAYDCIVRGEADEFDDPVRLLEDCYKKNETDEFITPRKAIGYPGLKDGDSFIFYNFRTDRPRQLTQAVVEKGFDGFERGPMNVYFVAMTQYYKPMNAYVAFEEQPTKNLLGEVIARAGLRQLRISETEKYAHVTFFFNGQGEEPNKNEDRILISSPKVATYDLKPEMSAFEIADRLVQEIDKNKYDFIVVNLVNGDMVGHTGVREACIKAAEAVDRCVEKITEKILEKDGVALIFADHGNLEDKTPAFKTSHTMNKVPFILVSDDKKLKNARLREGKGLLDIAPTVLKLFGIKKPAEMSGEGTF
ncbi:2,3-bisphosphoglycerate-independent phosphoglycerate mutase [Candidatus Woesearchaeota archaeon CG08_land_8_20_14_0_20_47_9]|nr:MAG: phosphoglycerate mutase (2,3-diphosphoglycerate-independent) [Candidatus Woesearchaeota archaeon CG1_02_47_18]PIO04419.1 MAG: 2,3-bisphosphoglycerate-independent phosphoglycerate mutase [Candidatus Woesearchaeota archaeon CG08_land_8_20_14_0_20_47_9]HII29449.1 2,3-bisphosphoglycerate-independent phosphoglycerate mutase [Candidatus Woesearchaeota archaeon]